MVGKMRSLPCEDVLINVCEFFPRKFLAQLELVDHTFCRLITRHLHTKHACYSLELRFTTISVQITNSPFQSRSYPDIDYVLYRRDYYDDVEKFVLEFAPLSTLALSACTTNVAQSSLVSALTRKNKVYWPDYVLFPYVIIRPDAPIDQVLEFIMQHRIHFDGAIECRLCLEENVNNDSTRQMELYRLLDLLGTGLIRFKWDLALRFNQADILKSTRPGSEAVYSIFPLETLVHWLCNSISCSVAGTNIKMKRVRLCDYSTVDGQHAQCRDANWARDQQSCVCLFALLMEKIRAEFLSAVVPSSEFSISAFCVRTTVENHVGDLTPFVLNNDITRERLRFYHDKNIYSILERKRL